MTALLLIAMSVGGQMIVPATEPRPITNLELFYREVYRVIELVDGSRILIWSSQAPNEPNSMKAMFVSKKGRNYDTSLSVADWIPKELADGTVGQVYSFAMSDDYQWLAVTGGWRGKDERGHNGVFLLRREPQGNFDYWRLKGWFDVRGMTIGEIAFGPDDTIMTTSHEDIPGGGVAPLLTIFTFSGQKLGSFIDAENHGAGSGSGFSRLMRIVRTGPMTYAIYDPANSAIRHLAVISENGTVRARQTSITRLEAFPASSLLAVDVLPDGRVVMARTKVTNRRGRTILSVFAADGRVLEEWQSPRVWRSASVANHQFYGFFPAAIDQPETVELPVTIR